MSLLRHFQDPLSHLKPRSLTCIQLQSLSSNERKAVECPKIWHRDWTYQYEGCHPYYTCNNQQNSIPSLMSLVLSPWSSLLMRTPLETPMEMTLKAWSTTKIARLTPIHLKRPTSLEYSITANSFLVLKELGNMMRKKVRCSVLVGANTITTPADLYCWFVIVSKYFPFQI